MLHITAIGTYCIAFNSTTSECLTENKYVSVEDINNVLLTSFKCDS